jgi:deoxyribonuclease-4
LVRFNLNERYVHEDEIGRTAIDSENELIVEILRMQKKGKKKSLQSVIDLNTKLKAGDVVRSLASGIAKNYRELNDIKEIGAELDIFFSVHTPYYIDLIGKGEIAQKSQDNIRWCGLLAHEMGGDVVVTHMGMYGTYSKKKAQEKVIEHVRGLRDWYKRRGVEAKIGLETSGKQEVFGSLDEIIAVCKRVSNVIPVLNFAHIHAREKGSLKKKDDFQAIFDKLTKVMDDNFYIHFSGVEHEDGNEKRYTPVKRGDLRFEPLAESILDTNKNMRIISDSPLLEHDAMYMKVILERVLTRREAKAMRAQAKEANKGEKKGDKKK